MASQRPLKAIVCIQQEAIRTRCLEYLLALQASGQLSARLPKYLVEIQDCQSPENVLRELQRYYQAGPVSAALLISDLLAEANGVFPEEDFRPTSWGMEVLHDFDERLLGTVAIMDRLRRVPDIDRVLWQNFDDNALLNVFVLVADKLAYIAPPERSAAPDRPGPVVVRLIDDQAELQNYFRLRHRVYCIMGYLEPRVETALSEMEIDACDTRAIHIGAFVRDGAGEKLVGTTRVVSLDPLDKRYEDWTIALARSDPVLTSQLDYYNPLGLPIFQSMRINDTMVEVLNQNHNCGELSRVIVAEEYRGKGLSELLVRFGVLEAVNRGVSQLLLECLPIHERMYRKLGFERMQGVVGRVIGVDKTMIAMELNGFAVEQMRKQPSVSRFMQVMRDNGFLRSCQQDTCGLAECDLYTKGKCPPR